MCFPQYLRRGLPFALLFFAALFAFAASPIRAQERKPNIVLLYADDLDFDELGIFDDNKEYPTRSGMKKRGFPAYQAANADRRQLTPHIDGLAKSGAAFSRFYITSPVCTPSRYSLLTGRYAERSASLLKQHPPGSLAPITFNTALSREETNIARELKKRGYATGFTGKWHNFPQGSVPGEAMKDFPLDGDPAEPQLAGRIKARYDKAVAHLREGYGWDFVKNINIGNTEQVRPQALAGQNMDWHTEAALEFIGAQRADRPFFLYYAFPVPHGNYRSLSKLNPLATTQGLLPKAPRVQPSREEVTRRVVAAGLPENKAMGTWMDDSVGAILKKLEEMKLGENTLIVFISDHQSRAKNSGYEGARVPAFMRWPGKIKPETRIDALTCNNDIAATLLTAAGGAPPKDMMQDGHSLLPLLKGPVPADWRDALLLEIGYSRAVVTADWKYIANRAPKSVLDAMQKEAGTEIRKRPDASVGWNGLRRGHFGAEFDFPAYFALDQLYHLNTDLFERKNLVDDPAHAARLAQMRQHLARLLATLPHPAGEIGPKTPTAMGAR